MNPKLNAIKAAYGDAWEKVKDKIDENGWTSSMLLHFEDVNIEWERRHHGYDIRPKSLKGLDYNNGWTRLEDKLPPSNDEQYHVCIEGVNHGQIMYGVAMHRESNPFRITHWRPVVKLENPIY